MLSFFRNRPARSTSPSRFRPVCESLESREVPAALLQVIHNSPYDAAAVVDVYVNGALTLDDLNFRDATPFLTVPSGVALTVAVAPGNSAGVGDAVFTNEPVTLADGTRYIAVAAGDPLAAPTAPTAFDLEVFAPARATGTGAGVDVLAFHGSPDAPPVGVSARGVGPLVPEFAFRDFAGYLNNLPTQSYTLDVTLPDGTLVRSFTADLSGAGGAAVTVLASGLVGSADPRNDFQLLAVFADGTSAVLPTVAPEVNGTNSRDVIFASENDGIVTVSVNGRATRFLSATNPEIRVNGRGGNDYINAFFSTATVFTLDGGAGNDTIVGGQAGNVLIGGAGNDDIFGGFGNDVISGGDGNDFLFGGLGNDRIRGGRGSDFLFGGFGTDDLDGGDGFDLVLG